MPNINWIKTQVFLRSSIPKQHGSKESRKKGPTHSALERSSKARLQRAWKELDKDAQSQTP